MLMLQMHYRVQLLQLEQLCLLSHHRKENMINKYKPILLKILNIFKVIILILLVCFVIFTAYQKVLTNNPSLFGYRTFSIITDSMSPKLKVGDVILIKEKKAYEYKVGDIITFNGMS